MKHLLTLLSAVVLLAGCCSNAGSAPEEIGPYTVQAIDKNVWHIEDFNASNPRGDKFDSEGNKTGSNNCSDMYLIIGKKKALLIDLSNNVKWAEGAADALRSIVYDRVGDKELVITFTHNHGDHTGMMHAFLEQENAFFALPATDFSRTLSRFPEGKYEVFDENDYTFDLGGAKVNTLCVPGHTHGSTVFFYEGKDMVFTGDAVGSGDTAGVWIFSYEGFKEYVDGIDAFIAYIEDPANGIDKDKLTLYGGHSWQIGTLGKLDAQYLYDMRTLIGQIAEGTASYIPYSIERNALDAMFKYGKATITWELEFAARYAEEVKAQQP